MTYELRTYTATPGRMDALMERFRSNTIALFAEHDMRSLGYWIPVDRPEVLVYLLQHDGDPKENWTAFASDPRWTAAKEASEVDGALTASIESVFLEATDLYPIAEAR